MSQTISEILRKAAQQLISVTDVPSLEAEILLAHVLQVSRNYFYSSPEKLLDVSQQNLFSALVQRRLQHEPIAYLIGRKEFWSLDLIVTKDTLIPRPETELLVELILKKIQTEKAVVADLGTGSGAIALALAHEKPNWEIYAVDKSQAALEIAKLNARNLHLTSISFHLGSWCSALPAICFDVIVSNPPYIAECDVHLTQGDLPFEPRSALVSGGDGLNDIRDIIQQAKSRLKSGGYLFLEHGFQQSAAVMNLFQNAGYTNITVYPDLSGLDRVTAGQKIAS